MIGDTPSPPRAYSAPPTLAPLPSHAPTPVPTVTITGDTATPTEIRQTVSTPRVVPLHPARAAHEKARD